MQIAVCQFDMAWHDKSANHTKVQSMLNKAQLEGQLRPGALIILPEMFATGYSMSVQDTRDDQTHLTRQFLTTLAQSHQAYVLAGIVDMDPTGKGLNQAIMLDPAGKPIGCYSKMHPTSFMGETQHYTAGDQVVTIDCAGLLVAPFICYDLRFPEIFRAAARNDAQLLAVIASWPQARQQHWLALLKARAIENQAYVVGVNRCGTDPSHRYAGGSQIIDPTGQILADASDQEMVLLQDLDLSQLDDYRTQFPFLRDMRDDFT
jgi:omega-amidase